MKKIEVLPNFERGSISFEDIPLFQSQTTLKQQLDRGLSPKDASRLLEAMLYIRAFEEVIIRLKNGRFMPYKGFKYHGATHLSIGQEAVAAGTMAALQPQDNITSTHRGHGHAITKVLYRIYSMNEQELMEYLGKKQTSDSYEQLLEQAVHVHLYKAMAELLGKEEGYCRGRGGSMHIADFHSGHLGANAIVGGSMAIATGAALSSLLLKNKKVVACMVGDGASNNGICIESMNFSSMPQFGEGFPVIYIFENNQYGMTGQQVGEVTAVKHLSQRGAGYNEKNMHARTESGMHVLSVKNAVEEAARICRDGDGPVLLEFKTYRYLGHSLSDKRISYRTSEEEEAWLKYDPIDTYSKQMIDAGITTREQVENMKESFQGLMEDITVKAAESADPDPKKIYEGLFSDTTSEGIGDTYKTVNFFKQPKKTRRDSSGRILYRHAVIEALTEEMQRDSRVVVYGEDVADYGGAFHATEGLLDVFGRRRIFNTPISESAIVGTALGASMTGLRPVAEIMYIDFALMAGDQIGNQVAKTKYMFGGKAKIPLVIRTTIGGGRGYAGQHSQSLEAFLTQFPGLKVVVPFTAYDVKGLLKTSIREDNPVFCLEHQHLYVEKDPVPEDDYTVPLGKGVIRRQGKDLTMVSYSYQLKACLQAAEQLEEKDGISVEVVDPRTLVPLDTKIITGSVKKTGRLMVVVQAPARGCFGEHIMRMVQQEASGSLKGPMRLVAAHEVPPPMSQPLERENIPSPEKIAANVREALQG
ncbi:MAG: alpha-ketoacid dehydrogenase subunit alpha/beta [Spirochaetota bacterium]